MKLELISQDSIDIIKSNLDIWKPRFDADDASWLEEKLEGMLFLPTSYEDIPDFEVIMDGENPFATEAKNVEIVYGNLQFLTDSQASDERLWAGLGLGHFWKYIKYRWNIDGQSSVDTIRNHFFFGMGPRVSLTRQGVARLWWIGRLTYDGQRSDPFELTKLVCEQASFITDILERNTSNNPCIVHAFLDALLALRGEGITITAELVRELSKYLNVLGGTYLLDCLSPEKIILKVTEKGKEIAKKSGNT
jgi:hypothetical protein